MAIVDISELAKLILVISTLLEELLQATQGLLKKIVIVSKASLEEVQRRLRELQDLVDKLSKLGSTLDCYIEFRVAASELVILTDKLTEFLRARRTKFLGEKSLPERIDQLSKRLNESLTHEQRRETEELKRSAEETAEYIDKDWMTVKNMMDRIDDIKSKQVVIRKGNIPYPDSPDGSKIAGQIEFIEKMSAAYIAHFNSRDIDHLMEKAEDMSRAAKELRELLKNGIDLMIDSLKKP